MHDSCCNPLLLNQKRNSVRWGSYKASGLPPVKRELLGYPSWVQQQASDADTGHKAVDFTNLLV